MNNEPDRAKGTLLCRRRS